MSGESTAPPPGWYPAKGDPPGTQRYWDGSGWQGDPRPVPGVAMSDLFPLADLTRRLPARAIDVVIWLVAGFVIDRFFGLFSAGGGQLASLIAGLFVIGYETYLVGTGGATVGKRVLGLAVVTDDGSPADLRTGARRAALLAGLTVLSVTPYLFILSWVAAPLLVLAGILMIYADDRQQTPWDKVGKTLVVMR